MANEWSGREKTGLVVLFNHNYEKNIPLIKELYKSRFADIRILMPFYYGDDEEVIGVYGNSYTFQTYIAQAREKILSMDCDSFLIIGDDVYLNPEINSRNLHEKLALERGSFYIDGINNVSSCDYARPVLEASRFRPDAPGLDPSANRCLPSYDEAYGILKEKNLIGSTRLSKWKLFFRKFKKPFFDHFSYNCYVIMSRCYHVLRKIQYLLMPVKMPYPYVFGYSDMIVVPRNKMTEWCRILEVFATWNMFVEMAIPTAMLLVRDANVSFADGIPLKTGNVWYPSNPQHYAMVNNVIDKLVAESENCADLAANFPKEYLYLHPVKLSRYAPK